MYTTYWSNWHHGTNTYYWKYNLLIKPHIKDYSDWNDNCVVSKTKFLSFFFGLGVFMMIGIWKYKPQEKSKNIDKAWSSIFFGKDSSFLYLISLVWVGSRSSQSLPRSRQYHAHTQLSDPILFSLARSPPLHHFPQPSVPKINCYITLHYKIYA